MKTILLKKERLSCCLLLCVLFIAPLSVSAQTFTFTAIPDQDETRLKQRFDQVADYLQSTLNVPVKYTSIVNVVR